MERPTSTIREVDTALDHGLLRQAEEMLQECSCHPESATYLFREARIALYRADYAYAKYCFGQAIDTGNLSPSEIARFAHWTIQAYLRENKVVWAMHHLEECIEKSHITDQGWIDSIRGSMFYIASMNQDRLTSSYNLGEASRLFEKAENAWIENPPTEPQWQTDNRWWWFRCEYRLMKSSRLSGEFYVRRFDNLRQDVLMDDPSPVRRRIARFPFFLFWKADRV